MASWIDVFSLVMTTLCVVGTILGVLYMVRFFTACKQSFKASLQDRGITLSREGVSLKTGGRLDRETYVDATQRGFVKILGAATVGPESHQHAFLPHAKHRSHSDERKEKH